MNILLLDLGKELRGGQRQVLYLVRHLARDAAFWPVVAGPKGSPLLEAARGEGIEVLELAGAREWNPVSFFRLNRFIRERDVHVVHTNCSRSAALGALLKMLGSTRFRLLHSRRVSYFSGKGWSREKYRWADRIAAVSGEIREIMIERGVDRPEIEVIHSGIDLSLYPKKMVAGDIFTVGFVGALTSQKGASVLVDAFGLLAEYDEMPEWKGVLVGDGKLRDGLAEQIERLGLNARVELAGWRDSKEVLADFDMLVVPSVDGEGSSGVVKEAWAVGLPLVVSDLPSNLELAVDNENALVTPAGDAEAVADAISRIAGDPELAQKIVAGGDRRVQEFTDERMAERYKSLYYSFYPPRDPRDLPFDSSESNVTYEQ